MYNIAIRQKLKIWSKTAIASLYFQCYNPISYSGHPRGSKYRLAKMWEGGGGARGSYLAHGLYLS